MAKLDLEAFLRERALIWDPELDVSAGSPFDVKVVQPLVRRLGSDPFTVDLPVFVQDRIAQEYPDYATREGDALTDLLIKPAQLLLDPVVREVKRVKDSMSFQDPSTLTVEEADALGGNLFNNRVTGDFSRGVVRLYFASPQIASVSPANYCTSKTGLIFHPTSIQSIRSEEMLLNTEGSLYYFDINLIAEAAGDEYNIGPDEIVSIANLSSAVRVTNKRKFRAGIKAETSEEYAGRLQQELGEQSLVNERGILAKVQKAFPEATRIAVVGFNDPEMTRDVVTGGGLGPIISGGSLASPILDGEGKVYTRRVRIDSSENPGFLTSIGPVGPAPAGFVITLHNLQPTFVTPRIQDFEVKAVVDDRTLDLVTQTLQWDIPPTGAWTLRKQSLTLSDIPGGILFPDASTGQVEIANNEIHIGGMTDIYVGAPTLDEASVLVTDIIDDSPALSGIDGETDTSGIFYANDLVLGTDYTFYDDTYTKIDETLTKGYAIRILNGTVAGTYTVLAVRQELAQPAEFTLRDGPTVVETGLRWQLLDTIEVDLLEPKHTKLADTDLVTVQATAQVTTGAGTDFNSYGIAAGDTLRILTGPDAGDYGITGLYGTFNTYLLLDRAPTRSLSGVSYEVFTANASGGVLAPLVRISSIDLLDSSSQPIGTTIPYAKPVNIQSEAFTNTGQGVKVDVRDALLGVIGEVVASPIVTLNGQQLKIRYKNTGEDPMTGGTLLTVTFSGVSLTLQQVADQINAAAAASIAVVLSGRLGLIPILGSIAVPNAENNVLILNEIFGSVDFNYSSRDIRSAKITALTGGWTSSTISPAIDHILDVAQVMDGTQVGSYSGPTATSTYLRLAAGEDLSPEFGVHLQVGARSLGLARLYFLEPTTIEVGPGTVFEAVRDGGTLQFIPDLNTRAQRIPALPDGVKPKDGVLSSVSSGVFRVTSATTDFISKEVLPGDLVILDYLPLIGSVALADPVVNLAATGTRTLILSTEDGIDQVITFVNDSSAIASTSVTRQGVADQINRAVGKRVAKINGSNNLELEAEFALTIKNTGTANTLLGFPTGASITNESPNKGEYPITSIYTTAVTQVDVSGSFTNTPPHAYTSMSRHQVTVVRPKTQRISSTDMAKNLSNAGLYYCDFELMSDGTGDIYNLPDSTLMTASGYKSEGYYLSTGNETTTFSAAEQPTLHLSRKLLPVGVSDDPSNAIELSGQNIQINYDRSTLVSDVQNYVMSESERVTNSNPLVRHLIPFFVRFDLNYVGGSKESEVLPDVEEYITSLNPQDSLTSDGVQSIVKQKGATSIDNPVELIAVVHNIDRSVTLERSYDRLNTGRLAGFIPDQVNVTRRIT